MAGPINLKLRTNFFNKIGQRATLRDGAERSLLGICARCLPPS